MATSTMQATKGGIINCRPLITPSGRQLAAGPPPPPGRSRKLLLHAQEIRKLIGGTSRKGLTIVPLELYFKDGLAKVAIALAKAKQQHDKREELKRRVAERELARGVKGKRA